MDGMRLAQVIRSVQHGIHWLKENADGLKDPRDIAITISALVAAERNRNSHLVQRLVSSLIRQQSINGSWSDELWDTTWAVKALNDVGMDLDNPSVEGAFRFIAATQDPFNGTWYEEPFETILVLELVAAIAPHKMAEFSTSPLDWVASLQRPDGCVIGIRYTGMVASLFHLAWKTGLVKDSRVTDLALEYIRRDLESKPIWSGAAWSNAYPLNALIECDSSLAEASVTKAVEWFIGAQDADGKWMQVSRIHDTAMAVLALSRLLTTPLVDISDPRTGILNANRENGTIRVSFHGPGSGAITPAEKMKISDQVREDLSHNQQLVVAALGKVRGKDIVADDHREHSTTIPSELEKAGRYAYGHLIPARIQMLLEASSADHLRLDIDERLIDLPWELIHDGTEFLCLRYAVGRRLISDQTFAPPNRHPRAAKQTRVLIVADPTGDLPAARQEGGIVAALLRDQCGMRVDESPRSGMTKKDFLLSLRDYDIIHFAGHASHDPSSPDESCLVLSDGEIQAFEIARFIASRSPAVVFLNACWSAEELRDPDSYTPMMRGLGRTFLFAGVAAFLGYLVPVPDDSATRFAATFYESLAQGQTIGESVRRARIACRNSDNKQDLTWSSVLLYGDPAARTIDVSIPATS